jgi:hypothetical protein
MLPDLNRLSISWLAKHGSEIQFIRSITRFVLEAAHYADGINDV